MEDRATQFATITWRTELLCLVIDSSLWYIYLQVAACERGANEAKTYVSYRVRIGVRLQDLLYVM
jgi:hypothetical protein